MAMDLSWVICSKCGKGPSDADPGSVITFTLSEPILCGICCPPTPEADVHMPGISPFVRRKLAEVLIKLTPLSVAYVTQSYMGAHGSDHVTVPLAHLAEACAAMKEINLLVYGEIKEAR